MTSLVTDTAELAALVGDGYTTARLQAALSWASSEIRNYCNQDFSLVEDDVIIVDPVGFGVFLPETPVTNVSLVEMRSVSNGVLQPWTTVTAGTYLWKPNGQLFSTQSALYGNWPTMPQGLRVTYSHGYAAIPQALKDLCLRLAVQHTTNPSFLVRHKVGEKEDQWDRNGSGVFTPIDVAILDRYSVLGIS